MTKVCRFIKIKINIKIQVFPKTSQNFPLIIQIKTKIKTKIYKKHLLILPNLKTSPNINIILETKTLKMR